MCCVRCGLRGGYVVICVVWALLLGRLRGVLFCCVVPGVLLLASCLCIV